VGDLLVSVDILPVAVAPCRRGLQKAVQVLDEGGFARARMADYPHQLPVGNGDVYVVDGDFFKRECRRCKRGAGLPPLFLTFRLIPFYFPS
jgi:hypothetical protein